MRVLEQGFHIISGKVLSFHRDSFVEPRRPMLIPNDAGARDTTEPGNLIVQKERSA
jgi:hypothetical protein